jgi:proteasome maturation protein
MRMVPAQTNPSNTTPTTGAPSAPGVHDTLRANLSLTTPATQTKDTPTPTSHHPLESRLQKWRSQQQALQMTLLRRQFGIAEPVKRQMELSIVGSGEWRPQCLGGGKGSDVHKDILAGRDTELDWEDVFTGEETRDLPDFHVEMEGRFGMGW